MALRPKLPEVGDSVRIMGITAVVMAVEPASDYMWHIELDSISLMGNTERWSIQLPTDFRTTDGKDVRDN